MCYRLSTLVLLLTLIISLFTWYSRLPGRNGLGYYTTAKEAIRDGVNLEGKNLIITGGYKGIGASTVEALAALKPNIWLPARGQSFVQCLSFAQNVTMSTGNENIYCEEMDLESFMSVRRFADMWKEMNRPIHILILNAGVGVRPFLVTEDGFESIWQSNHLGHFLLTNLLMDNLKQGAPCRVVAVSSHSHTSSHINWDDISGKKTWWLSTNSWFAPVTAYSQSKTANILFANKLNELLKGYGVANSLHPGLIKTDIGNMAGDNPIIQVLEFIAERMGKTKAQGAATQVYLATAPELATVGGLYFDDCNIVDAAPHSTDPNEMEKLWTLSLESVRKWLD